MATIIADVAGGVWSVAGTWIGGVAPGAGDDAVLNASSGSVTVDAGAACRSLDCAGYIATLAHNTATTLTIGDATAGTGSRALRFSAAMTYTLGSATTSAITFASTSTTVQTVDFAGKTTGHVTFDGVAGTWQYTGTHTTGVSAIITLTNGALDTNGYACTWGKLSSSNTNTRSLQLRTSAIAVIGTGTAWNLGTSTNLTFDAGTSVVTLSGGIPLFAGGGQTYATVIVGGVGNTVTVTGANTFGAHTITAGTTIAYPAGVTQTITAFTPIGTAANPITVSSSAPGTPATLSKASGYVEGDWLTLTDSAASGGADWWAGANSTDVSGNTGWVFTGRAATGTAALTGLGTLTFYGHAGICPPVTGYGDVAYGDGPYGWPLELTYDDVLSRVRVTTYGVGAYATTITVDRSLDGVTWTTVRGGQDREVAVANITVDDYEFIACSDNIYRVRAYTAAGALIDTWQCTISTPVDGVWLKSISRPFLNQRIDVADWTDIVRKAHAGTFDIIGRSAPVAVTDVRSARTWTMIVFTDTQAEIDALTVILSTGEPVFVHTCPGCSDACDHAANTTADFSCAVPGGYVLVGDTGQQRVGPVRTGRNVVTLPLTEIAAPGPDIIGSTSTWATVLALYGSWSEVLAVHSSWTSVLELVGSPGEVLIP